MQIDNPVLYNIWKDRYCKNNETIDDNLHRVAKYCSQNEKEEKEFYDVMNEGLFFPAGRTMSNAVIGRDLTLNNCFVAPQIKDDLSDIFDKVKLGAVTHQKGGGIG
jgi:ribonucleoside-diphosphate reductase alpha chain